MTESHAGGFGTKLREARERRGQSLRQIAQATKISVNVLEALERNDFSRLPGGIFSRGFVRSYAIEVGLEPEETIQEFIAQFPHDSLTAARPTSDQVEDNQALESDRRMASTFLWLLVAGAPIAAALLYFGAVGPAPPSSSQPAPPVPEAAGLSSAPATSPTTVESPAPITPPESPPAQVAPASIEVARAAAQPDAGLIAADRLMVGLLATGPCWVSVVVDGQPTIERQFEAGEHQLLDVRRELVLTAGDAAALTLTLNGAEARPLGPAGKVVTTRLNLTNFKDYLARP